MKLGLKSKRLIDGKTEKSCLLFKAKGEVRCKYQQTFLCQICVFQRWWLVHEQNPVQVELLRA